MALSQFQAKRMTNIFFLCFAINLGFAVRDELIATTDCICLGQNATYECTTDGGNFTVWSGSIMEPPSCTVSIRHAHDQFFNEISCNDGTVIGRGLPIVNDAYTSLLTVLVTPRVIGGSVSCALDIDLKEMVIDTTIINITTVPFPPPNGVRLIEANAMELVFGWSPPPGLCPSLTYRINAENCGTCQNVTTTNNTTCTNFPLPIVCTMKIYSVTCGNLISTTFDNTTVNLRVLNITGNITVVPHYSESDSRLLKIETQFNPVERYSITNEINGSATGYTITYLNQNTGSICGSSIMQPSSCRNNTCTHIFEIASSSCPPASNISARVFATNVLGQGSAKNSTTFASGTNTFVDIKFSSNKRCIICNYRDGNQKECNIRVYGANCSQLLNFYDSNDCRGVSDTDTMHEQTTPQIEFVDGVTEYCFTVTAHSVNGTLGQTIVIEGTLNLISICNDENNSGSFATIVLAVLVAVLAAVLALIY